MNATLLDTQMLSITFPDTAQVDISSVDLWALTWQSRDLIVLAIWAFSALNYFKSSKGIKFLESGAEDAKDLVEDTTTLSLEIDYIWWELYE